MVLFSSLNFISVAQQAVVLCMKSEFYFRQKWKVRKFAMQPGEIGSAGNSVCYKQWAADIYIDDIIVLLH